MSRGDEARAVPVIQADRDAAADMMVAWDGSRVHAASYLRCGNMDDHEFVQAFARQRRTFAASQPTGEMPGREGGRETFSIVLPNDMGRAEVRSQGDGLFATYVVAPQAAEGEYRSAWNLPTFEAAVRNIMDVIWPGCLPFAQAPMSDDELVRGDPAQIALDQQTDDPQPGDWNDACRHIAGEIRAASSAALLTPAPSATGEAGNE